MYYWSVLQLEPTEDIKEIKKAYAKRLKLFHPEDDPEGFQQLKEAYDAAIGYAKYQRTVSKRDVISTDDTWVSDNELEHKEELNIRRIRINDTQKYTLDDLRYESYDINNQNHKNVPKDFLQEAQVEISIDEFMDKLDALYRDFNKRIRLENWKELFQGVLWDMEFMEAVEYNIITYFNEHINLTIEIGAFLNSIFNWTQREEDLITTYGEEGIADIIEKIKKGQFLSYTGRHNISETELENYLIYRDSAYSALIDNELHEVLINVDRAREIYDQDPELYYIEASYYMSIEDYSAAMKIVTAALKDNTDNKRLSILYAKLSCELGYPQQALDVLENFNYDEYELMEILLLRAKCYVAINNFEQAREVLLMLDGETRNKSETNHLFKQTYKHLRRDSLIKYVFSLFNGEKLQNYKQIKKEFKLETVIPWLRILKLLPKLVVVLVSFALLLGAITGTGGGIVAVVIIIRFVYRIFKPSKKK